MQFVKIAGKKHYEPSKCPSRVPAPTKTLLSQWQRLSHKHSNIEAGKISNCLYLAKQVFKISTKKSTIFKPDLQSERGQNCKNNKVNLTIKKKKSSFHRLFSPKEMMTKYFLNSAPIQVTNLTVAIANFICVKIPNNKATNKFVDTLCARTAESHKLILNEHRCRFKLYTHQTNTKLGYTEHCMKALTQI